MKRLIAFVALSSIAGAAFAAEAPKDTYVGGLFEYQIKTDSKFKGVLNKSLGLDLIYGDRSFGSLPIGFEGHLFSNTASVNSSFGSGNVTRTGLGVDATYPFGIDGPVTPFVLGGLGVVSLKGNSGSSETKAFAEVGAGVLWAIPQSSNWRVRGDLRFVDTHTSPDLREVYLKVGAEYSFGGKGAVAKPAEEINVVPSAEKPVEPAAEPAPAPAPEPKAAPEAAPRKVISLKGVTFGSNSDQLQPTSTAVLDDAAKKLNSEDTGSKVEVAGHTDNKGDEAHNKDLSQRRAKAVMDYLVQQGVDAKRLSAVGYGSEQPVADNNTKAGRAKNRRVELRVM